MIKNITEAINNIFIQTLKKFTTSFTCGTLWEIFHFSILTTPFLFVLQEVPFEVSLQNVACLEAMFDPSRGNIGKTTEAFYSWLSSLLEN